MRGDERRRGGEERSWDAFKTRTHTSESGGKKQHVHNENIKPDQNKIVKKRLHNEKDDSKFEKTKSNRSN